MRIGIDARMYGYEHAGIGRYVQNLVDELSKAPKHDFVLLMNERGKELFPSSSASRIKIVETSIPHYSLAEQLRLPLLLNRLKLDLFHFPHFNAPVFYRGRYVLTIHDLIKHISYGRETTTRSPWLYWPKYAGYRFVFARAINGAGKILVPSEAVKAGLLKNYSFLPAGKIVVTYEGVDEKFNQAHQSSPTTVTAILKKYQLEKPFAVYTGSVYPHKNIDRLIQAVKLLNETGGPSVKLVISCARNVFWQRLKEKISQLEASSWVVMAGYIPDDDLRAIYQAAEAFVFPTLSEGFGLPGLEAMSVGLPVVCSDIPVLREIYGEAALFFDPYQVSDIAEKLKEVLNNTSLRQKLKEKGRIQAEKYSWKRTAAETLAVYENGL